MRKSPRKLKHKFVVLCRIVDWEDDDVFLLGNGGIDFNAYDKETFDTAGAARAAMKKDYNAFAATYDAHWSVDGKDHRKRTVLPNEISIDVPIWDAENQKDSWIRAMWKIVSI